LRPDSLNETRILTFGILTVLIQDYRNWLKWAGQRMRGSELIIGFPDRLFGFLGFSRQVRLSKQLHDGLGETADIERRN
jgi:hypothetical protein